MRTIRVPDHATLTRFGDLTGRAVLLLAAAAVVLALAGCDNSPGVVVDQYSNKLNNATNYYLVVRHDESRKQTTEIVTQDIYMSCGRGDRWPECAR